MEPPFLLDRPVTRRALAWAEHQHRGQRRALDDAPFILHPLEVAALLSGRGHDDQTVAAGLLHDVVEATSAGVEDVRAGFGDRVAALVEAVSEDPSVARYDDRKAALRARVAAAGQPACALFAADKVVKCRELRAQLAAGAISPASGSTRRRLEHYERSLEMLREAVPEEPLLHQLAFELWALRALPPGRAGGGG